MNIIMNRYVYSKCKFFLNGDWESSKPIQHFTPQVSYTDYIEAEFVVFQDYVGKLMKYLESKGYSLYNYVYYE